MRDDKYGNTCLTTLQKLTWIIECPYYKSEDTRDWLCHMSNKNELAPVAITEINRLFVLYKDTEHEDLNAVG